MMHFKVDENLHVDAAERLRQQGHDAATVFDQGLQGESDGDIANLCQQESRAIITLDLDFANIGVYPPADYDGIVVFRLNDQSRAATLHVLDRIIPLFESEPLAARLWIVDEHQVRIRE